MNKKEQAAVEAIVKEISTTAELTFRGLPEYRNPKILTAKVILHLPAVKEYFEEARE